MKDIMKIVKSLQESDLLIKVVTKATENETKKQRGRFLGIQLGNLGASLLRNMLASKGWRVKRVGEGRTSPKRKGTIRGGQDF